MSLIESSKVLLETRYSELRTRFDPEQGVLWTLVSQDEVPCVTNELLENLLHHHDAIKKCEGQVMLQSGTFDIRYSVMASLTPNVFNLGGQLALFRKLIDRRDRAGLLAYATKCIDVIFPRICRFDSSLCTTITLIQGDALGGGLEAALASDVVIAERHCQMGFPEILFNLFPGMGAYSLIARKVGNRLAEKMMLSGKIYSAQELHEMGLVDVLAEAGEGEKAVHDFIRKQERRANGFQAIQKVRQRYNPVTYQELIDITTIWVESALKLTEKDLKVMDRLVRSQERNFIHSREAQPQLNAA
ncbi:MAG: crotonase/enoyl-CoA hydratase family protein [Sideroxydans sp.]